MMSKKILLFLLAAVPLFGLLSCSETTEESTEFSDWQNRNETYFNSLYAEATASATDELDTIRSYAVLTSVAASKDDYIIVKKLESGTSTSGCPMFTDSVKISYRGRYIPTTNYADGYVFDQTYLGDFNWETVHTTSSYKVGEFVTGFTTALLNMQIGDRWRVYIPYKLGYGESASGSIPAYSTLIFDISLHAFYRPDADKLNSSAANAKTRVPVRTWITK